MPYRLSLNQTRVDVLGIDEAVLIYNGVLRARADHPDGAFSTFAEDSATGEDIDLRFSGVIKIVVGGPSPEVLRRYKAIRTAS